MRAPAATSSFTEPVVQTRPQIGLCLFDPAVLKAATQVVVAASGGIEVFPGTSLSEVLAASTPAQLRLLVVDIDLALPGALEALTSVVPNVAIVLVSDAVDEPALETAVRIPGVVGFVARSAGRLRTWELGYLVRRILWPEQPIPGAHELLVWGASTIVFRPRTQARKDQVVTAIDLAASWYGVSEGTALIVANAARELLTTLVTDPGFDKLPDELVPSIRLTVDPNHVALDLVDPFGKLTRPELFRGLLRGRWGPTADTTDVEIALCELLRAGSMLRIEGGPGREVVVSWLLDRGSRARRSAARSVFFVGCE
ncbi:MAG: hypothetical protein ABMA64_08740 [Myxococcota bacterium]